MASMKVLIVSQFYTPDITAAAFRIAETADLLRGRGWDVRVVTAEPHKSDVRHDEAEDRAAGVRRVGIASYRGGGMADYLRHYFSFVLGAVGAGIGIRRTGWRADVIWVTSPPLFVPLAGFALSWAHWCPVVVDIRDIWPESAVAAGQLRADGAGFRIGKLLERLVYGLAHRITCVSSPMARHIATRTTTPASVVYNGVRTGGTEPQPAARPVANRIMYAGNLGRAQGLDTLIRAFARLADTPALAGWTLDLVGGGALDAELRALAASSPARDRIVFHGTVSKPAAAELLAGSRMLFINLVDEEVFALTIPSKVFDYMLVERPILYGVRGEAQEILASTGANVGFTPSDEASLTAAIGDGIARIAALEAQASRNADTVRARYSREAATEVLAGVLAATAAAAAAAGVARTGAEA
jgi:glycosyltransferase involved in cell wall biosynthesis